MSRDRIYIYVDGVMTPAWRDNGPGYARAPGQRGEMVVGISQAEKDRTASKLHHEKVREVCGVVMAYANEPCVRRPGHRNGHATRATLDTKALGRPIP